MDTNEENGPEKPFTFGLPPLIPFLPLIPNCQLNGVVGNIKCRKLGECCDVLMLLIFKYIYSVIKRELRFVYSL